MICNTGNQSNYRTESQKKKTCFNAHALGKKLECPMYANKFERCILGIRCGH